MALLATAYEQLIGLHMLVKIRRAAQLWNEGEKALAHFHLDFVNLPIRDGAELALRLFVAGELIEAGVEPGTLMKAQGFDPAPPDMLKFNPGQ
ncbi:MAG TPA: hypothetical protein VLZ74_15740, partial [Methylocella sp.]|nr:hypothetical protein [Methylocella sp.]